MKNQLEKDDIKEQTLKITEEVLENAIIRIGRIPQEENEKSLDNVRREYNKFLEYAENILSERDPQQRHRILESIRNISYHFENLAKNKFEKSRSDEGYEYTNSTVHNMRSMLNRLDDYSSKNLIEGMNEKFLSFSNQTNVNSNDVKSNIRKRTIEDTKDSIENVMFQEIRGSFRYNEFKNKDEFMQEIRWYLSNKLSINVIQEFDNTSNTIDKRQINLLNECLDNVINQAGRFIDVETKKEEEKINKNNEERKELSFLDDLKSLNNSVGETINSEKDREDNDNSNRLPPLESPILY